MHLVTSSFQFSHTEWLLPCNKQRGCLIAATWLLYCLQETQALLSRISPPSAAILHKEYDNINRISSFLNSEPQGSHFDQIPGSQLSSTLLRWCALCKPLLQVIINEADHIVRKYPGGFSAVGVLLNALGMCLEGWVQQTAAADKRQALKQDIAQHTGGKPAHSKINYCSFCMSLYPEV